MTRTWSSSSARVAIGLAGLCLLGGSASASGDVVVRAGTIHSMDAGGGTIANGALLIRDGKIVRVGADVVAPPGAHVVDYGPDAVVVPGFVAADSGLATGRPPRRTAEPGLSALDGFDFYGKYDVALSGGVTSAYLKPATGRLIAGQGAVVKLGGSDPARRVLVATAVLHGSISADARATPGYWDPPLPPGVDSGLGWAKPQLPNSTMGAIVALEELLAQAQAGVASEEFGPNAPRDLAPLLAQRTPWRMTAETQGEIRALLAFAAKHDLPLVVDGASQAAGVASEIASAGVPVVFDVVFAPNSPGRDRGRSPDDPWPDYGTPAVLTQAGVKVALSHSGSLRDLVFAARLAMRGGLDREAALRAITLAPAEILGAAGRVGSLAPGKDADLVVFAGEPLEGGVALATWLDGEPVWEPRKGSASVVLEVDELYVGDGTVLRPGSVLMKDGRIVEVSQRVARPDGAKLVRGKAAMPGMIDALGFLGLESARETPAADYALGRIVGPGDDADRRVALSGVTTVVLSPRGDNRAGVPMTAYKPAARDDRQVVQDPAAVRVVWTEQNRLKSGQNVRDLLDKAVKYREKWQEYATKLAEWEAAPKPEAGAEKKDAKPDETKKDDEAPEEKKNGEKKEDKKKKKEEEPPEADPVTGIWEAALVRPPLSESFAVRIQLSNRSGSVEGSIRCDGLSDELIQVAGHFDGSTLTVTGLGTQGWVELTGTPKKGVLDAVITLAGTSITIEAKRTRSDLPRAELPPLRGATEEEEAPKDKPRPPKLDAKLEPFRRALDGAGTVVVSVDREDEIEDCVDAFAAVGIRPVLYGARGIRYVADLVADRIDGVMLRHQIVEHDWKEGLVFRNRYAELEGAGIRIAFHSLAEEGAADLPTMASYAVANGLSADGALRAVSAGVADMFHIDGRVGRLQRGLDADVLLLDGPPLDPATSVLRAWVNGEEVLRP